ncbi:MAG: hypothetical protein JKY60_18565 [Kordiimonadaceae bacterium]|nr:hypothetical protein [Kordiimonadaceae bacterium]
MKMSLFASIAGLLLAVAPKAVAAPDCYFPDVDMTALAAQTEFNKPYIFLGELHGNVQSPTFTAELVCAFAAAGKRVLLAVETPENVQVPIKNPDGTVSFAENDDGLSASYWVRGLPDGRTSEAYIDMIITAHALEEQGLSVKTIFADVPWGNPSLEIASRDEWMMENVAKAKAAGAFDIVVFLSGNFHNRLPHNLSGGPSDTLLHYVDPAITFSINLTARHGTSWACFGRNQCGVQQFGEPRKGDLRPVNQLILEEDVESYHALFRFPEYVASPPLTVLSPHEKQGPQKIEPLESVKASAPTAP